MKRKQLIAGLLGMIALMAALGIIYLTARPEVQVGDKEITITITGRDGQAQELDLTSDAETLGDLLCEQPDLIVYEESAFGRYILGVDGETADESRQEWWCITKDGQPHNEGMDSTRIADGERYELTLTTGY